VCERCGLIGLPLIVHASVLSAISVVPAVRLVVCAAQLSYANEW
jgi:hypothetical protein